MAQGFAVQLRLEAVDHLSQVLQSVSQKIDPVIQKIKTANNAFHLTRESTQSFTKNLSEVGKKFQSFGKWATGLITLPVTAALTASFVSFTRYEEALVGVGKTTNLTGEALKSLGSQISQLSERIPLGTNSLLGIAQAAGQLGVKGEENLLKFTETLAQLQLISGLSGEEAATSLTRILNITGEGVQRIDTLASVVVALSNQFAASEQEIVEMASEVSKATALFRVSSSEAAALSAALKSIGIEAEGANALGKTFRSLDAAIRGGGDQLKILQKLTGLTGKELEKTFKEDALLVFQKFIEGLDHFTQAGGNSAKLLSALGLGGDRVVKVLPLIAHESSRLGKALSVASEETQDATALNEEAAKTFATTSSQLTLMRNTLTNVGRELGELLAPAVIFVTEKIRGLIGFLREHPLLAKVAIGFTGIAAAIGPVIAGLGVFLTLIPSLIAGLSAISAAGGVLGITLGIFTSPMTLTIAAITALTVAGVLLVKNWDKIREVGESVVDHLVQAWDHFKESFQGTLESVKNMFVNTWRGIVSFFNNIWDPVLGTLMEKFSSLKAFFQGLWGSLLEGFEKVMGPMGKALSKIGEFIFPSMGESVGPKEQEGLGERGSSLGERGVFGPRIGPSDLKTKLVQRTTAQQASVLVDFRNLPRGVQVTPGSGEVPLNLSLGFAGAIE